jgi:hypothetical protein
MMGGYSQIATGPAFCRTSSQVPKVPTATEMNAKRDREHLE